MIVRKTSVTFAIVAALLATAGLAWAQDAASEPAGGFSVLHITDIHISPHLVSNGPAGAPRGADTITWLCEQAKHEQTIDTANLTAPSPAFCLATGDLTEYGVIDDTWDVFQQAFANLPCPIYAMAGNHDNTWGALYQTLRERHGGENYSFDHDGWHFVCISSASPQEPVPTIDAKTRAWLKADLETTGNETPIIFALHHPLYSNEFAPAELDTLLDLLRDYNVVMMLCGHGHNIVNKDLYGIPSVMGGSTFGKRAGYGLLTITKDAARYAYRYHLAGENDAPAGRWQMVCEQTRRDGPLPRLITIDQPPANSAIPAGSLMVELTACDIPAGAELSLEYLIDGKKATTLTTSKAPTGTKLRVGDLLPGEHLLSVRAKLSDGSSDVRTRTFYVARRGIDVLWHQSLPAAIKAAPVLADNMLIIARNDGLVQALDRETGEQRWQFQTGGEILGTPAWADGTLVFGSGDGAIYALDADGKLRWKSTVSQPVYAPPLIEGERVYIGDNGGRMHALSLATGGPFWTFDRADFGIEAKAAIWNNLVVFGAWDGHLYAVSREDGSPRWRVWGPKSSEGKAARYYAPADCGPLVRGDKLFVCDRGYQLGEYAATGELVSKCDPKAAAIAPASDGGFFARTTDDRVVKFAADGKSQWEVKVPAGRFPIPPTEHNGRLYVCSNTGLLNVLNTTDGSVQWQFQATPGCFVMAPVTVSTIGEEKTPVCYVAGMDGTLVAVRQGKR